jgi:uroporphyrinogen III methyltransferase/synthase
MKPPATIIVGEVVRLRDRLNWYEHLPLFGKRIVVTRAKEQAETFSARLRELGAAVIELPTIEIQPAPDYAPLDRAVANLGSYDWLIFTSANGVRFFMERLDASRADLRSLRARLCAIGPATRAAVEALHLKVDVVGKEYVAEALLEALGAHDLAGKRVLLPRAAVARDLVPAELTRRGALVDVVEAYRTVPPEAAARHAAEIFGGLRKPDCITFTSSSTVRNFVAACGTSALEGVAVLSIGPVTTRTARDLGISVTAEAPVFSMDGLLEAIVKLYTKVTPP